LDRVNITPYYTADPELSYMFRHILSREVAYNLMLYAQRQQLHQAIAQWYEIVYAEELNRIYPLLAFHWHEAAILGQMNEETTRKAIEYLDKAGAQALRNGAMREAAQFFGNLLALLDKTAVNSPIHQETTALQWGRWHRYMGQALLQSGQAAEARPYLERALAFLEHPAPASQARLVVGTLGQYGRQILHRTFPRRYLQTRAADTERLLEVAQVCDHLGEISFVLNDTLPSVYYTVCRVNTAERAAPSPQLGAYASICMTMSMVGMESFADGYGELALDAAQQIDELSTRGLVMLRVAAHYLGYCRWTAVFELAEQIDDICAQISDWQLWATNKALIAPTARYAGQFPLSLAAAIEGQKYARRSGNRIHETWGVLNEGVVLLAMGEMVEGTEKLEMLLTSFQESLTLTVELTAYGMLAVAYWQQGQKALAQEMADKGLAVISQISPVAFFTMPGYGGVAEATLRLLAESPQDVRLQEQAKQAMKAFKRFARSFPFARPYLHLCQGIEVWLSGKPDKAFKLWQKGVSLAESQNMPYEKGVLLAEYGRCHPNGQAALAEAARIFAELGCRVETVNS
jgi:tetratricopeptide (TPR) repeat protein